MKKCIIVIACIFIVVAMACATCFGIVKANSTEAHLNAAVKCFKNDDYDGAILRLDKALSKTEELPEIYLAKANAQIALGERDTAFATVVDMVECLKIYSKMSKIEATIVYEAYNEMRYPEFDDILMWFYEETYGKGKYDDVNEWIEGYLDDSFDGGIKIIKKEHEEAVYENYVDIYREILSSYAKAEHEKFECDYFDGELFEEKFPHVNSELATSAENVLLMYMIADVNEDEVPELFIRSSSGRIYDMYGICGDRAERLFDAYSMGYRMIYSLCEDGIVKCVSDGGVSSMGCDFYKINSASKNGAGFMTTHIGRVMQRDGVYYSFDEDNNEKKITEEEYNDFIAGYKQVPIYNLDWKPVENFLRQ